VRRRGTRGGTALPAALAALVVATALVAAVTELARVETLLAEQRQRTSSALAAADGCLADVVAAVPAGWDFAPALAGPDGVAGTADDGTLAAPAGCTATARAAPGPAAPARMLATVTGTANGGRRVVDAVVGRAADPGAPALVWLGAAPAPGAVAGTAALDGTDPTALLAAPYASLATPAPAAAVDAWLAAEGAHVSATGGTAPARTAPSPPVAALGARLAALGAGAAGALPPAGTLPGGTARVAGDLAVLAPFTGAGVLFVDGVLDIHAAFDFSGLVITSGPTRVAAGASLSVAGALWAAGGLDVAGTLAVRLQRAAIDDVDARIGLPRLAVVSGVRDLP